MEVNNGGETPRKPKTSKRPVVISPSSMDDTRSHRQQVGSVGGQAEDDEDVPPDPVSPLFTFNKFGFTFSGQGACGPCQKYRVKCVPQANPKKAALACAYCTIRKLKCQPLASWAQALQDSQHVKPKKRTVVGKFLFPTTPSCI
jgi:hypothetical protein